MKLLLCVPTYNESESILKLLTRIDAMRPKIQQDLGVSLELLVIDDNSPDGTAALVRSRGLPWVSILEREEKGGLGPAYIAGFKAGLAGGYAFLGEMDADLSHEPESLVDMLRPVSSDGSHLTIGTRWMPGGKVVNWPIVRQLISRAGTGYARLALGIKLRDVTSGYRIFRREVLERIDLDLIEARGYGFQIEMTLKTLDLGFQVKEVPITFVERVGGVSKMSKGIVLEALWKVTLWAAQRRIQRR